MTVIAEEIEAEIIRSRLEAEGIPARIAPRSRIGYPAAWSPRGLGFGIGSFEVRVPTRYARAARDLIGDVAEPREAQARILPEPPPKPRAHLLVRLISSVILLGFLLMLVFQLAQYSSAF